jgi:hypothetical protein
VPTGQRFGSPDIRGESDSNQRGTGAGAGGWVAALFYSLIESAKLCGVEPQVYLREATPRAVRSAGMATRDRDLKSAKS